MGRAMTECTSESIDVCGWDPGDSECSCWALRGDSEFATRTWEKDTAEEGTSVSKGLELRD